MERSDPPRKNGFRDPADPLGARGSEESVGVREGVEEWGGRGFAAPGGRRVTDVSKSTSRLRWAVEGMGRELGEVTQARKVSHKRGRLRPVRPQGCDQEK